MPLHNKYISAFVYYDLPYLFKIQIKRIQVLKYTAAYNCFTSINIIKFKYKTKILELHFNNNTENIFTQKMEENAFIFKVS